MLNGDQLLTMKAAYFSWLDSINKPAYLSWLGKFRKGYYHNVCINAI